MRASSDNQAPGSLASGGARYQVEDLHEQLKAIAAQGREELSHKQDGLDGELARYRAAIHELQYRALKEGLRPVKRLVLIGAESTGKTTLAEQLAMTLGTEWVPEYGREYTVERYKRLFGDGTATTVPEEQLLAWTPDEFVHIAKMQQELENAAASHAVGVLVCDTNAFTTAVWYERYLGSPWPPDLKDLAENSPCDLYVVTKPDFPFVQDDIRDGEKIREWMHGRILEELIRREWPFEVIGGTREERLLRAVELAHWVLSED